MHISHRGVIDSRISIAVLVSNTSSGIGENGPIFVADDWPSATSEQRRLAPAVQTQKLIHYRIDKAEDNLCWNLARRQKRPKIGDDRAVVPVAVAISARLVLPGIAPERGRA